MRCVVCKQADTQPGFTTVTLQRGESTFVVKDVPAQICPNCGEDYVDERVTAELLNASEDLSRAGTQVDVRRYAAGGVRR
jgi:YgiT-type zinc finger domain-containing protein